MILISRNCLVKPFFFLFFFYLCLLLKASEKVSEAPLLTSTTSLSNQRLCAALYLAISAILLETTDLPSCISCSISLLSFKDCSDKYSSGILSKPCSIKRAWTSLMSFCHYVTSLCNCARRSAISSVQYNVSRLK